MGVQSEVVGYFGYILVLFCYALPGVLHEGTNTCDCPLACDVTVYEPTISTAAFPNPSMVKILQRKGFNRSEDYFRYVFYLRYKRKKLIENITLSNCAKVVIYQRHTVLVSLWRGLTELQ